MAMRGTAHHGTLTLPNLYHSLFCPNHPCYLPHLHHPLITMPRSPLTLSPLARKSSITTLPHPPTKDRPNLARTPPGAETRGTYFKTQTRFHSYVHCLPRLL